MALMSVMVPISLLAVMTETRAVSSFRALSIEEAEISPFSLGERKVTLRPSFSIFFNREFRLGGETLN